MTVSVRRTEQAMERQRTGRKYCSCKKAVPAAFLLCLLFLLQILYADSLPAEEKGNVLEKSGIRYPEGFDQNTVGEIQGRLYGLVSSENGPVYFSLLTRNDKYTVIASPSWYWHDLKVKLNDGEEIRILGSKSLGKDGNLYIIAQEISIPASGQTFVFRDTAGRPFWKGGSQGTKGMQGGMGSPMRGGNSFKGGTGRGRR